MRSTIDVGKEKREEEARKRRKEMSIGKKKRMRK
jgi:hypothetical protein